MRIHEAKELINDLEAIKIALLSKYESTPLTLREQDELSDRHTHEVNQFIRAKYPMIRKEIAQVFISVRGIEVTIDMGDRLPL